MMKGKTKVIPIVMVALIGVCIFAQIVNAETTKEWKYYYDRGNSYYKLEQNEKAIEDYTKAIELNPEYAELYNMRGMAYYKSSVYEEAKENFAKALELNPRNNIYYWNRGNTHYALRQYEKAIKDYNEAIKLNPEKAKYYNQRGDAYYILGEYKKAEKDYTKAIELLNQSVTSPTPEVTPTPTPQDIPGFGIIVTIAGLLAVAYLLRRRK